MLPETVYTTKDGIDLLWSNANEYPKEVRNSPNDRRGAYVLDTELLHLCWLVEEEVKGLNYDVYETLLHRDISATWQQRVIALAKVKGVEIC
jgi:hypothetical protein